MTTRPVDTRIRVSQHSDIPLFRQIVTQVTFMVETGQLADGDRLPGTRLLADNLGINRNTVARAYGDLRRRGLVESRGRRGMVVVGAEGARAASATRDHAHDLLASAVDACIGIGLGPAEIAELAGGYAARAAGSAPRIAFVECNTDRATALAHDLEHELGIEVEPLVLGGFEAPELDVDLVLTTFFHLAEVRALARGRPADVVALVVAPHIRTLVEIASVPHDRTVGLWYPTEDQAISVRDSLQQAGITNVRILAGTSGADLRGIDVVVLPSERPDVRDALADRVRVIEFGNVLDASSVRMVRDVVRDLRPAAPPPRVSRARPSR
ncbi:DNA-binding transcriptional regulator YhcF (GntR family) [Mumia flava]|uniref:DNA-binding transcriptional regulator YhcF (GntR family) n=1 Tax=Mumia flava TaxID=1348852 RepID=A0A0B2BHL4_9ACTN|nr:GntR family transcriptional regulator [Mumia flava]PJJ54285.1 DNA-binding transcriptional regulator YhcF (GntR family) [Mumia flava]